MNDSDRERILDRRIRLRLRADNAYRNAETAEEQAQREEQIAAEEEARLDREAERAAFRHRCEQARIGY